MDVRLHKKDSIDFGADLREDMPQPSADIVTILAHDSELRLLPGAAEFVEQRRRSLTLVNDLTLDNPRAQPAFESSGAKTHAFLQSEPRQTAATVECLIAFAAPKDAVKDHDFEPLHEARLADPVVRAFIAEASPAGPREMAERFLEAIRLGLWTPRSNSARALLEELTP